MTKNDHFARMLQTAHERGFRPRAVNDLKRRAAYLFDSWYASVENIKRVRDFGWTFVTRLKANRKVRIDRGKAKAVSDQPISASGTIVWLPGFGEVRVFRIVAPDGDTTHWVTNDLGMDEMSRLMFAELS